MYLNVFRHTIGLVALGFDKSYPARSGAPTKGFGCFGQAVFKGVNSVGWELVYHVVFWNLIVKLGFQRSCLHGSWSGRTSPEDIQARDGISRVWPLLADRTMQKMQPWRCRHCQPWSDKSLGNQHEARLNSTQR